MLQNTRKHSNKWEHSHKMSWPQDIKILKTILWLVHQKQNAKTKFKLSPFKAKRLKKINISFAGHCNKQRDTTEYLGCQFGFKLSEEAMASKALMEINTKLKFLFRQSRYLTSAFGRLLSSTLIQPRFDHGCSSWFPILKKSLRIKLKKGLLALVLVYIYLRDLQSIHRTLEK